MSAKGRTAEIHRLAHELRSMADEIDSACEAGNNTELGEHAAEVEVIAHALRDVASGASA